MQFSPTLPEAHDSPLITWCIVASLAMHTLLVAMLPGWSVTKEDTPKPLLVEIVKPPEGMAPPKPLPLAPEPPPKVKPKPEPVRPVEQQRPEPTPQPKTVLTAPPDTPAAAQAPVIPVPPPAPAPVAESKPPPEPPRAQTPPPPPAPVTPPSSDAAYLNNPRPDYPLAAKRRGDQGTVLVRVIVTADGLAKNVGLEKSSGFPALDAAAVAAVRSWRFVPAKQGTQSVEAPFVVPMVFKLD